MTPARFRDALSLGSPLHQASHNVLNSSTSLNPTLITTIQNSNSAKQSAQQRLIGAWGEMLVGQIFLANKGSTPFDLLVLITHSPKGLGRVADSFSQFAY